MARKIDSLLKKGWMGEEVGKELVASIIHDIRYQGKPDYKPLFSQSDFEKMENSLSTEQDYLVYGIYRDIYNGLINSYNRCSGQKQQFQNGYYRYTMYLKDCTTAEQMMQTAELIPYVMTNEQYEKLRNKSEIKLRGSMESFSGLFFDMLSHIIEHPENAPKPVADAIAATEKEIVTNKRILERCREDYKTGYYTLPDGTRSDSVNSEEWVEKLKEQYTKTHKLQINGEQASFNDTVAFYNHERLLKGYKIFFNGIDAVKKLYKDYTGEELPSEDEADMMNALENFLENGGSDENINEEETALLPHEGLNITDILDGKAGIGAEWHYYTELPKNITKFDIISENLYFYDEEESWDKETQLSEFKADYPDLYKALEAHIKEIIPKAKELKPAQYGEDFISWGELAELKVGSYQFYCSTAGEAYAIIQELDGTEETMTENFLKCKRLMLNGIVIAQAPNADQINEKGEYIDNIQHILSYSSAFGIDSIDKNAGKKENIQALKENLFLPALKYIYAFNALIKILGDIYGITDIEGIEINTERFESQLEALNNQLYRLYGNVYGTKADKERKRKIVKEVFQPTDFESLKPTKESVKALAEELHKLGLNDKTRKKLKNFDALIAQLCDGGL